MKFSPNTPAMEGENAILGAETARKGVLFPYP
jgi:hypothetical protein